MDISVERQGTYSESNGALTNMSTAQSNSHIEFLTAAISDFEEKNYRRSAQEYKLQLSKEYIRREQWGNALHLLRSLWQNMSFRTEGWWSITEDIGWTLRTVAAKQGDGGTFLAVSWELMNKIFKPNPRWNYDLSASLNNIESVKVKPAVVIREPDVISFLSTTLIFDLPEGKVGEPCTLQLMITSRAMASAAPILMDQLKILFEGSLKPILLENDRESAQEDVRPGAITFHQVVLKEQSDHSHSGTIGRTTLLVGKAPLLIAPGKCIVFEFTCALREPGSAKALSATFSMATSLFDLDYVANLSQPVVSDFWWSQKDVRRRVTRPDPHSIVILPRPPKIEIRFITLEEQFYTNEAIILDLDIVNGEDEHSTADIAVHITGANPLEFRLKLENSPDEDKPRTEQIVKALGEIAPSQSKRTSIEIAPVIQPDTYDVIVELSYHLISDPETSISRKMSVRIIVVSPFEANYDFSPRFHPDPWPSFFRYVEGEGIGEHAASSTSAQSSAQGLPQKWCLTTRYASFASGPLLIEDVDVELTTLNGSIAFLVKKEDEAWKEPSLIQPKTIEESHFEIITQKLSLDDRRSASLDLSFNIRWRRNFPNSSLNTTKLPVPRLLVAGMEPRVLATSSYSSTIPSLIHLEYTIENPSMHFLTFAITMSPGESFAFSGVKQSTVQLVPLSRRSIRFKLIPSVRGEWIRPQFVVKDRYFQKVLKIAPTEGMKVDKEGILLWVPPDDDDDA